MNKIKLIFKCFGIRGFEYIVIKLVGTILRLLLQYSRKDSDYIVKATKYTASKTDNMVARYIYSKYSSIYAEFEAEPVIPLQATRGDIVRIIWTVWLQGEEQAPEVVKQCINSFRNHAGDYQVIVISLDNIKSYVDLDPQILLLFQKGNISAAHLTDYIRVLLLSENGGIWMDATQFMIRKIPEQVWQPELLLWNKVVDATGRHLYASIPFVEHFNNGFMVAKKDSVFFKFAVRITRELLNDPILQLDYFANFKAYLWAFNIIPRFKIIWEEMPTVNPFGLIGRQFWNQPVTDELKQMVLDCQTFFILFTYKIEDSDKVDGVQSFQSFVRELQLT